MGIANDVDSLNPFVGLLIESYELWALMYDTLTGYSAKDYSAEPGLAESWHRRTARPWTYRIRSGVTWSDGVPLTAKDAAYTFTRIINGEVEQTNYGSYVANIVSAQAPDATTLVLTVSHADAADAAPGGAHPARARRSKASPPRERPRSPTTPSGGSKSVRLGFVLTSGVGQFRRSRPTTNYWAGAPHIDGVEFRPFASAEALAQALRKGEIDFADSLEANIFDALKAPTDITLGVGGRPPSTRSPSTSVRRSPTARRSAPGIPRFEDKQVRLAIAHAVDLRRSWSTGGRRVRQPRQRGDPADVRLAALRPR